MKKKILFFMIQIFLWGLCAFLMFSIYRTQDGTFLAETVIDDRYQEYTPSLSVGDTLSQTFSLPDTDCQLESFSIAFSYEEAATEAVLLIRIFQGDILTIEQELPLSACPDEQYLTLYVDTAPEYKGSPFTVQLTNLSAAEGFRLLSTTDTIRYEACTEGYRFNNHLQQGSLFVRMQYPSTLTSQNFYGKATKMFLVFLTGLILSELLNRFFRKS